MQAMIKAYPPQLVVGFKGVKPEDDEVQKLRLCIEKGEVQGVILFGYNIENSAQLKALTAFLAKDKPELIVAVDQEGGLVQRLPESKGFKGFPSAQDMMKEGLQDASVIYSDMAKELADHGINFNFGPCVDVNPEGYLCPVIGDLDRSYGAEGSVVDYATAFIKAHQKHGVKTCLKHFPGHGSAQGDTHKNFTDVSKVWKESEMNAFQRLVKSTGVEGVMTAHISHKDWNGGPATFSQHLLTDILRKKFGFEGMIVSDDMHMGAILANYTFREALEKGFRAGVTCFVYSVNPSAANGHFFDDTMTVIKSFQSAVREIAGI